MIFGRDIGIDLGTATVIICLKSKGIATREPSVVAMDKGTGHLLKVGAAAQRMLGRTPGNIAAIHPIRDGVISDYDMTQRMLKELIRKVSSFSLLKPRIIISVPSGITEVEEPVVAAIGAGLDIAKPEGHLVVNIGAGTTDIAVISLSGVVQTESIKVAGDAFNRDIIKYIRRHHNVLIGDTTAEEIKRTIGCVYPRAENTFLEVKGRCLITGLPKMVTVSAVDTIEAFSESSRRILDAIHSVLEETPPELIGDISENGIVLTGGGCLLYGFDKLVENSTGIHTRVADDAELCAAYGITKSLSWISDMQDGTLNLYRRKQLMQQ